MTDTIGGQLELGWRYNPAEHRNEHGEWSRLGGEVSALTGDDYKLPDESRLVSARGRPANPADHPFFKAHPVSAANVVAMYDKTPPGFRQQGMRWYSDAHTIAKSLAGGDADKGAGVLAAYSPQTSWPVNMLNAARALELGRAIGPGEGMITGSMQHNAQEAIDGIDTVQDALVTAGQMSAKGKADAPQATGKPFTPDPASFWTGAA